MTLEDCQNSPPPQRKTVECFGWKWTRWRRGGDGDWGGWGVIPDGCHSSWCSSSTQTWTKAWMIATVGAVLWGLSLGHLPGSIASPDNVLDNFLSQWIPSQVFLPACAGISSQWQQCSQLPEERSHLHISLPGGRTPQRRVLPGLCNEWGGSSLRLTACLPWNPSGISGYKIWYICLYLTQNKLLI